MSLYTVTHRNKMRWFRERITSGPSGGKRTEILELGTIYGTINPDADLESPEFGTTNEQISASIYFDADPNCKTNDYYQVTGVWIKGGYTVLANGPIWRVESVLDFQNQNRLWRVRATKRKSLAS